jgi:ABC-2 type transport system permease protein
LTTWLQNRNGERGVTVKREPIELLTRFSYNPELESRFMLIPGAIAIVLAMIGCLLTALIMAREYEHGTIEGLLATPISVLSLLVNKLIPYLILGLATFGLCVFIAIFIYALPLRGSLFALTVIGASFLFAVLGQGLFISAITRSQFLSTQIALVLGFLPSMLMSGFLFEIDSMPRPIQWLTYLVPARYLVGALQSVFLVGDVWGVFLSDMAILIGIGAFFFWLVTRTISRKIV